jgi:hypothetical protein
LVSERVYLSSDVGRPVDDLARDFGGRGKSNVAFDFSDLEACGYSGRGLGARGEWWYHHAASAKAAAGEVFRDEWRPPGTYHCPGEPLDEFQVGVAKKT